MPLTYRAKVKKASSTPSLIFAEVSKNRSPNSSANCFPSSRLTTRFSSQSHLLPMRILLTPGEACCSMFECHVRISIGCKAKVGGRHGARIEKQYRIVKARGRRRYCGDNSGEGEIPSVILPKKTKVCHSLAKLFSSVTSYTSRIPIAPL